MHPGHRFVVLSLLQFRVSDPQDDLAAEINIQLYDLQFSGNFLVRCQEILFSMLPTVVNDWDFKLVSICQALTKKIQSYNTTIVCLIQELGWFYPLAKRPR